MASGEVEIDVDVGPAMHYRLARAAQALGCDISAVMNLFLEAAMWREHKRTADCATMPAQQRAGAGGGRMQGNAPILVRLDGHDAQLSGLRDACASVELNHNDRLSALETAVFGPRVEPATADARQDVGDAITSGDPMARLQKIGAMQAEIDRELEALDHILGYKRSRKPRRPRKRRKPAAEPTVVHVAPVPADPVTKPRRRSTNRTARKQRARR